MGRKKGNEDKLARTTEPSTSLFTRKSKSDEQADIASKVFDNPLLMNKIVKYSVYKSNGKEIDTKAVIAIRLVNKIWLQSASDTLRNSGDWLISLVIGKGYKVKRKDSGVFLNKKKATLDKFVSVFSNTSRSIDCILPIQLDIMQHFLIKDNRKTLSQFFGQFGYIICSLCVAYPLDGGSMNFQGNSLNISTLKTFEFNFEAWRNPIRNLGRAAEATTENNGLAFLQQILQNSPNLQIFTFGKEDDEATVDISSITLPKSVKRLRLGSPFTGSELTLVTNNPLPKLEAMDLEIGKATEVPLVYNILERLGQQLETLVMSAVSLDEDSRITLKFPLMAKLTYLKLIADENPLLPQLCPDLVPSLTHLVFQQELPESMFLDLIRGSRFENVKKLKFSLIEDDEDSYDTMSPSVQIIKEVIASFPNIEKLTLKYVLNDMSSLKYLFQNLPFLKKLDLSFEETDDEYDDDDDDSSNSYKLVSVFLGISLELATVLVDKTAKNVNVAVDNPESIMNLTELSSLTLHLPPPYTYLLKTGGNPGIISKHGLDKMPKLQKVKLLDGL